MEESPGKGFAELKFILAWGCLFMSLPLFNSQAGSENPSISLHVIGLNGPTHDLEMMPPDDPRMRFASFYYVTEKKKKKTKVNVQCTWSLLDQIYLTTNLNIQEKGTFPKDFLTVLWFHFLGKEYHSPSTIISYLRSVAGYPPRSWAPLGGAWLGPGMPQGDTRGNDAVFPRQSMESDLP